MSISDGLNTGYYQPYTIASCVHDTFHSHKDENPVAFPPSLGSTQMLKTSAFNYSIFPIHAFIYPGITGSQILDAAGLQHDYRLRWIELAQDPFNGTAIRAVLMLPRAPGNTTQEVLMCNLGAGWGASKLNMSTLGGGSPTVNSEIDLNAEEPSPNGEGSQFGPVGSQFGSIAEEVTQSEENQLYLPLFPQKPVT